MKGEKSYFRSLLSKRNLIIALLLAGVVASSGSMRSNFNKHQKAYYLDPAVANFVRPGVVVKVTSASINSSGTMTVSFNITDPAGLPLDWYGVTTPGSMRGSATVAVLPHGQNQYVNYVTSTTTNQTTGATAVTPGDEDLVQAQMTTQATGSYTFTFQAKAPSGFDATATHTVGIYVGRDLSSFNLGSYTADDIFSFVPAGGAVTEYHDEIRTQTCNKCHAPLLAHGLRNTVALCVLCHTNGAEDVNTGNTVDFKVFIHKIHMGSSLPSVQAGKPYQIIGFHGAVDFSDVVFPADARNCTMCHEGGTVQPPNSGQPGQGGLGAAAESTITASGNPAPENAGATTGTGTALVNPTGAACGSAGNPGCNPELMPWPPKGADYWNQHPSAAACGSCHDNVNFASGVNHVGGPQPDDSQCKNCHQVQGELPFDASIVGAHTIPQFAPGLPGVVFKLVSVTGGTAGTAPTVTYTLNDKSGKPLNPATMGRLTMTMAGPTGDYTNAISEDIRKGSSGSGGTYQYTFQNVVPAGATGSYSIGIEGYNNVTLLPGTTVQQTVRDVGFNDVISFSVDGSTVAPHPVEISQAQCNSCHFAISLHGTIRQNVQYCIMCHNPTATDSSQRPASAGAPQTIDFPILVHRIHLGDQASTMAGGENAQYQPFVIWGFGASQVDLSSAAFPGNIQACQKCHTNGSQELPLPATRINVNTPHAFINPAPPTTAACTACHIAQSASAHALGNINSLGESCDVCHGQGAAFAVDQVHAQ